MLKFDNTAAFIKYANEQRKASAKPRSQWVNFTARIGETVIGYKAHGTWIQRMTVNGIIYDSPMDCAVSVFLESLRTALAGVEAAPYAVAGDTRKNADGSVSELVDNGDGTLGTLTRGLPDLGALHFDAATGVISADLATPASVPTIEAQAVYWVSRVGGVVTLRQTRYRAQFEAGREHPHDSCAVATSDQQLRDMLTRTGFTDVDWS